MALLCPTAARALSSPVETTLRALLEEYKLDVAEYLLLSLATLLENLTENGLSIVPPVTSLGLDDLRVIQSARPSGVERALREIGGGETADVEFKSSLLFDRRRYIKNPGISIEECRLDALIHSTLKTMAGFANTDGGILHVGVEDDGNVCGMKEDFAVTNSKRRDYDGWEQFLRGQIESRFIDGKAVNAYVRTECILIEQKSVVRVQIAARSGLTFIRKAGGAPELYIRSGTRSVAIDYQDIQKHYEMRRLF